MTASPPDLDLAKSHRYFAVQCFNDAWALIERTNRTPEQDESMILSAAASLWHWMHRPDCTDQHRSIGHWQLARGYALVGQAENALRHGRRSLAFSEKAPPFFVGYAHESIARAAAILKDGPLLHEHLTKARRCLEEIKEADDRAVLEKDIGELEAQEKMG